MRRILAAAVMGTLLSAAAAMAQQTQDGVDLGATKNASFFKVGGWTADSIATMQKVSSTGAASTSEANKDRDNYTLSATVYNDTISILIRAADSTNAPVDVHDLRGPTLLLDFKWLGTDSASVYRIGVQVRGHTSSTVDSTTTYPYFFDNVKLGALPATADTVVFGHVSQGGSTLGWRNEAIVWVRPSLPPNIPKVQVSGSVAGSPAIATAGPIGMVALRLPGWWAPFMTVRFRTVGCTGCSTTDSRVDRIRITARVLGSSL